MLSVLSIQTTEEEKERRLRELDGLLLQVGRGDREAFARLLGQPLSTVLSKYHRGLKKLRSLMKGESDR